MCYDKEFYEIELLIAEVEEILNILLEITFTTNLDF